MRASSEANTRAMEDHDCAGQMTTNAKPVAVIGAGPIGLATAAHLHARGLMPLVLERGSQPGAAVREWQHVPLFSPWEELVDEVAARQLTNNGWLSPPPAELPTGGELVSRYLEPLAQLLGPAIR